MPQSKFILATRGSALALQQSRMIQAAVEEAVPGSRVELLTIRTIGDRMAHQPLPQIGGKGLFTKEIEDALLEGRADFAVHSLKDLPTAIPSGLTLAAVPRREDPRDALISRDGKTLVELPNGAVVGTSSVRRSAQIKRLRPDLEISPLRGNLDTRLRKLREGNLDAIILAVAGMRRMGFENQITEILSPDVLCPAAGQGALGIEARADDHRTLRALAALEDSWSRLSITAERALLESLGGGCQVPIAAATGREKERMLLTAVVIRPDGTEAVRASELSEPDIFVQEKPASLEAAQRLGAKLAELLRNKGANAILHEFSEPGPLAIPETP